MTEVFSVRIDKSLFNKVITEIENKGLTRKSFFEMTTNQYFNQNTNEKQSIQRVYDNQDSAEYDLLVKILDTIPMRYNRFYEDLEKSKELK